MELWDTPLRTVNTILGSLGLVLSCYIGARYVRYRHRVEFKRHALHVILICIGYGLLCLAAIVRSIFIPAHLTWAVVISTPGILIADLGAFVLFLSGHVQDVVKGERRRGN